MSPQISQPSTPQYSLATLNLFTVYASRAAYLQATGKQAPPFDPTRPAQYWEEPTQAGKSGSVTYYAIDTNSPATGYLAQLTIPCAQAASVNLPGVYNYPTYVSAPTDAVESGPFGIIGAVSPDTVCTQADAQATANAIAFLFPGQTPSVIQQNNGLFHNTYGVDPRRAWYIQIGTLMMLAQALIESQNSHGIGYPGAFDKANGGVVWIAGTPVTQPPAGQAAIATPVRQLLPNEVITQVPPSNPLFGQPTWVVERTDIAQATPAPTEAQQIATLTSSVAAMQSLLALIASKVGVAAN